MIRSSSLPRFFRVGLAAAAVALGLGCIQDDGTRFTPIDLVVPTYSDDDLRQLGADADREIREEIEIIYDPVVSGFLNELGQDLVAQIEPQPFIYRFRVIDARNLNAFAIPGGFIYIHSETLLRVASVDELAGVLSHEIAHINRRHFSKREAKTALPALLTRVAAMGAAVATEEPGLVVAAEGVNVALKIGFTREAEAEADQLGAVWMTRAGYQAERMTHFLDRIVQSSQRFPDNLPPYLSSHPFPEDRIVAIRDAAETLEPTRRPNPALAAELPRVQQRLALLVGTRRATLPVGVPPADRHHLAAALERADQLAAAGDIDGALFELSRVDGREVIDPRLPFQIGELLYQAGRYAEAAESYERTIHLDPSRAMVYFKLGLAFKETSARHRAVYAFEQAVLRAGDASVLRKRAEWEIFKLTFGTVEEAGFADGSEADGVDTPVGFSETEFTTGAARLAWWARLSTRFLQYVDELEVRWIDPSGAIADEDPAEERGKATIGSVLEFDPPASATSGKWTVELVLKDEVIERHTVLVRPRG